MIPLINPLMRSVRTRTEQYLRHIMLSDRKNAFRRLVSRALSQVIPQKTASIRESLSKLRISIVSNADNEPNLYQQLLWGDYWVKYELTKALGERGHILTDKFPDVIIHLFGHPTRLPKSACKIAWIYSHPDLINPEVLQQYDKIFCLSSSFIQKINQMEFEAELMIGATAKKPVQTNIKYDIVFIGNAHVSLPYKRKIVQDVGETQYNFKVWGKGWKDYLPGRYYGGEYFDNQKLGELYASSLIALNDHSEAMSREGFVAVRIFDILASGGFCISDRNSGIQEIFGDCVPQYESAEHLRELIDFYVNNPEKRLGLMEKGREIALSNTWGKRAEQFLCDIINKMNVS